MNVDVIMTTVTLEAEGMAQVLFDKHTKNNKKGYTFVIQSTIKRIIEWVCILYIIAY
jgi:3-hydroxyisobutyrate dehydrogenase-like beta-hydroxyacid dehydrogenase